MLPPGLNLIVCFSMLAYASYSDWRTREVTDKLWVLFSLVGIAFIIIELSPSFYLSSLILILVSILLTFLISFILYYFGFFGGADMKALIVASLLIPVYYPQHYLHPFLSITSLTNGVFLTITLPAIFLTINVTRIVIGKKIFMGFEGERLWKKILVCFLGYRTSRVEKGQFFMSLEKTIDGKRSFRISLLKDEEFISGQDLWVTPGIPLLIFITLGFLSTVIFGDFLALLFRY
ncbi:MAG: prepilin peptidase [Nitrososphaerales archaeon]|nr:prepilin peptidase [Nitrososphaerales archaeon]